MISVLNQIPPTQLYLLDAQTPAEKEFELFRQTYQFWHHIWDTTFKELKNKGLQDSDEFHRQKEICVLTSAHNQVIGSFSFSWFDLRFQSHAQHSYFKLYPQPVMDYFAKNGLQKIMTMGYLCVHPEWRKSKLGPFVAEVLVGATCKRFLESDADVLITFTRNNRKMNELGYRHGARCVLGKQVGHNVEVDYIAWHREDVKPTSIPGLPPRIDKLWNSRIESFQERNFTNIKAARAA